MLRRARTGRPAESLDAFLPRFDEHGVHLATPAELQAASRADEILDRQMLAEKARGIIARLPDIYRDAFVLRDWKRCPRRMWRTCWVWKRRRYGSGSTARA